MDENLRPTRPRRRRAAGLYIVMVSVHGLIRGRDLELGRDADTGGQTKYVVELAARPGAPTRGRAVDLITRRIDDPHVSDDYDRELEPLDDEGRRASCGCAAAATATGARSCSGRTSTSWCPRRCASSATRAAPDLVHGHYADAGYVAHELSARLGVPLVFTGHSLGRNKRDVLGRAGVDPTPWRPATTCSRTASTSRSACSATPTW
jgi:sucrose-phosphate synthase